MFRDLNMAIETLVGEWGTPIMPFEHELFLYCFQTWIYFPKLASATQTAITLAAARFLEELGKKYVEVKGPRKRLLNGTTSLIECLADDEYCSLYDETFMREGGWTALLRQPSLADFDKQIQKRRSEADVVCDIIDYRFRYLEYGGTEKKDANISHGQFYRWKKHGGSGKTTRNRWSNNKNSAFFLYVNERLDPFMTPPEINKDDFIQVISARTHDQERINAWFGICRYIVEILSGSDPNEQVIQIPSSVKSVRPITHPLSEMELKWMEDYSSKSDEMRHS
jgi:hypothetical protein